jgi:TolB-like protein/lipoprotein NlpI
VDSAIKRGLAKVPTDRYATAAEFATALTARETPVEAEATSIVVLPFENLSPDPDNAYFSDGLTEELIADLSKVRALRVISRTSAMTLKGTDKDVKTIGRELDVGYVVEGSVRKVGNGLRITVQLIDAATDTHVWAEKYAGKLEDVFGIQETVSCSVVGALRLKLTPEEKQGLAARPIENVQAYDCYLRARHDTESFTEEGFNRALEHLHNGLAIVGENALIYSGIGYTLFHYANIGAGQEEHIDGAEEHARRALALDPDSAEAHLVLGLVYSWFRGDQRQGLHHLKRSLVARPDDPHALYWLAIVHYVVGRPDAARALVDRLRLLDPVSPLSRWLPAAVDLGAGRFDSAADFAWHELPLLPHFVFFHAAALTYAQRFDDARNLIVESVSSSWNDLFAQLSRFLEAAIEQDPRRTEQALTEETARTCSREVWSYYVASFFALAKQEQVALEWLAIAVDRGFINYPLLGEHDPFLAKLRGQTRFDALMERVKYEWEHFEI